MSTLFNWAGRLLRPAKVYLMREEYMASCRTLGISRRKANRTLRDVAEIYPSMPAEEVCAYAWAIVADDWATDA